MSTPQALQTFADWVATIRGDEASEAQTYVNRLLQAWGWADAVEAGTFFEKPIPKGSLAGGMGKADALIEGTRATVLVEMKSRGRPLERDFPQLQRYWIYLTPKPAYALLCNFDQIWVYDFNQLVDEPLVRLQVADLASQSASLAFLSKSEQPVHFGLNQIAVTEAQARSMGELLARLRKRGEKSGAFTALEAQRFVLQCVLCMFAEDRGLLPNLQFTVALDACQSGQNSYDVLGNLFTEMNTAGVTPGGQFKGTPYFNGGLFAQIPRLELQSADLDLLSASANENWKQVRPSIFGNIFEASSDPKTRHAHGQHFTSEVDMLQIIRPTIVEPWEERIAQAKTIAELETLRYQLTQYRVCDPACGSGNFLYMGYNAVKDLEASILQRIAERRSSETKKDQAVLGLVTPLQFFGIDTSPFAVELARVTLMIARKVANDRLGLTERDLPLDNLDANIRVADALFTPWPEADAYVGNPPFLGGKHMRLNLGDEYVDQVFKRFPEVRDSVDFCTYWFRLAHDNLKPDGRAGLVATNSIRHGKSRRASLDYIRDNGGHIHAAISTQPWSGEANVHVSIVNWIHDAAGGYRLDGEEVTTINTSLRSTVDVSEAKKLNANKGYCFQGVIPVGKGFNVDPATAAEWLAADPRNAEVVKPFSMGTNLAKRPLGQPDRWIIDFGDRPLEEIEAYPSPFRQVVDQVRAERQSNREQVMREKWWRFKRTNAAMREALAPLDSFFAVPRVSKWAVFIPCDKDWLPGDLNVVLASDDFFVLGLVTSSVHRLWMHAQKSTLEDRTRYTHDTIFETFPFPQHIAPELVQQIRQAMTTLNDYRNEVMVARNWGITDLYNAYFNEPASQLAKLHQKLDALVLKAYGWMASEDILSNLLDLNLELAEREAAGEKVVGPWAPD
ncbi:DNA methyltransferase [Synechococcus sp. CS-205]|uniref:DNA methyltransferase n=1 Tax=Synechococcus sp. CS-205 TaxID=2847984 RepID=UPI00223C2690|nr:DNA methyltransferase [Synechococcus sp. CS-205]MCT0249765.1 N-6 DNA methylase [Synechococcus sp. CS-205]